MPLIDSPRITPQDQAVWDRLATYDRALARDPRLDVMAERAVSVIRDFLTDGGYVGTSWGKDSTVVAHLAAQTGLTPPLVWVRVDPWENPDTFPVRDTFLERWGHAVDYHEITIDGRDTRRSWSTKDGPVDHGPDHGFREAGRRFGARHVSGVRAEESTTRALTMSRWGHTGPASCRPIGHWTAVEVFAYLARHDLPIHPAYAMSMAGARDRRWLRVSTLGGQRGTGRGRAEWEQRYYGTHITHITQEIES